MECPNCRTANRETARFCSNCGTSLSAKCSNCGFSLVPGARFCQNCGQAVGSAVTAPPPQPSSAEARLQQYIPKELMGKLEAARSNRSMAGERRIVTVLFCDVKGSTSMAETLDPEEWADIMNRAFEYLIAPVYRYEGTLARLMGDAILAFFGAPIAHEDDPQRAVLAGLEIAEGIRPLREQIRREYNLDFDVRVGINTGLVVVGEVGSDLRVEYTAMGDAVNVASRMEQTAAPGTVQISGNTYKSVANLFEFEPLGSVELKGRSEPIPAYRALTPRVGAVPTRGIEGLTSPLVGRENDLNTLRSRFDELMSGRGQIVSVMGEAGLGKSRLVAELRKSMLAAPPSEGSSEIHWLEGRSLSYESTTPYAPFIDLLSATFGLGPEEDDAGKYEKVKASVARVLPDSVREVAPFLGTLLGIKLHGDDEARVKYLEPPQVRARIFQAVQTFFAALAATGPLVLVFEDLHWVDPTSLDLLEQLVPLTESSALLLLVLFRPHAQEPSWRFHELAMRDYGHLYTQVPLQPLNEAHSRILVANLLEIEDLPEKVRTLILTKAEGNPFFVEEVIRSLLDSKLVVREGGHWRATREIENISVPDTLSGVITARLDRLDEESKHVAQTASVIGREFRFDVLSSIYEEPTALDPSITNLQRRELVRERSRLPQRVLLFKHVLTQETAYGSVLLSRRRTLHLRVAECLERVAPERVNDISRHFLEAREEARALPYLVEAGARAARAASRDEAMQYYGRAIDVLQRIEDPEMARRAYEGLGKTLEFAQDIPGAVENYYAMSHYAEERGDGPMRISALNKLSYVSAFMMGQFPEADKQLTASEQMAHEYGDDAGLAELFTVRCGICNAMADFGNAERYLSEAVRLGRKLQRPEQMAYGLAHKSNTLMYMAQYEEAWETAQEGLRVAEEIGNLERRAELLSFTIPMYHIHNGDFEAARVAAEEGFELGSRVGVLFPPILAAYVLGVVADTRGEYQLAMTWYERGIEVSQVALQAAPFMAVLPLGGLGLTCIEISNRLAERARELHKQALGILQTPYGAPGGGTGWPDLGFCALALGDLEHANEFFQNGLNNPSIAMYLQRPRSLVGAALVALAQGRMDDAAPLVAEARQYTEGHAMKHFYPMVELAEGQLSLARHEPGRALEHFNQAESLAVGMGMRPIVWQMRAAAAAALLALDRGSDAAAKREEAAAAIEEIASLFHDEELREAFVESANEKLGTLPANA